MEDETIVELLYRRDEGALEELEKAGIPASYETKT